MSSVSPVKISKNIFMLKGANLISNSYLIIDERPFLVDTGDGSNKQEILAFIKKYLPASDLDLIINTHCHFDHIGGNEFLSKETGAKIAVHKLDASSMESKVDILLENSDFVNSFKVIHTPGHSPGSICLYNKNSKVLLTGDTVFSNGYPGRTDLPGGSLDQMVDSLKKLSRLSVNILLPGHYEPILENGGESIQKALMLLSKT